MKGEIDNYFYCSAFIFDDERCEVDDWSSYRVCSGCFCGINAFHRKYPTKKQYKDEYGHEWEGAEYYLLKNESEIFWSKIFEKNLYLGKKVCACTPFGVPPNYWRPKK